MNALDPLLASAVAAALPLMVAALGELVAERAGVLNLGLEGMMLVGALAAFITVSHQGGLALGVFAGMGAGALLALVFGFVTLTLQANQVAAGLSLTILGSGLSAFLGRQYVGFPSAQSFQPLKIPYLSDLPLVGEALFSMNALGYLAVALLFALWWFLYRTRSGLVLRSIGESPWVARSLGLPVMPVRYLAVAFGGAMSGLAGAYYTLAQFKMWQEGVTSGNGWIALALVVFATWRPARVAAGALLFGGVTAAGLFLQARGVHVSTFALGSLPYLATIVVLVAISADRQMILRHAPASLGKPFHDTA